MSNWTLLGVVIIAFGLGVSIGTMTEGVPPTLIEQVIFYSSSALGLGIYTTHRERDHSEGGKD